VPWVESGRSGLGGKRALTAAAFCGVIGWKESPFQSKATLRRVVAIHPVEPTHIGPSFMDCIDS